MGKILSKAIYPAFALALLTVIVSCKKNVEKTTAAANEEIATKAIPPKELKDFVQVNLVGDNDEYSPAHIDPNLVNGWGISFPASGPAWVSAEGTGKTVIYNGEGVAAGISPVTIPPAGSAPSSHPTGQVFNPTTDFKLPNGNPARFIFATAEGGVSGWNSGNTAVRMVNDPGDAYLGIALAADAGNNYLYVANFSDGEIEVFDKDWAEVEGKPFVDPNLPAGYSPFNIQAIDGKLYVMYAKVDPEEHEEEKGPGLGYVDVYNTNGTLDKRFTSRGQLNAPWGIAKAPASFFGDDEDAQPAILIGNFGDGHINAYSLDGVFLKELRTHGAPLVIDGLWAIMFPPSTSTIDPSRLYFAAGPDDEQDGLFGYIIK